jgi:hypothetical protein
MLKNYCSEMGQERPEAQMDARLSYNGSHWYIKSPLELKGRGIKFFDFNHDGRLTYKVTKLAFEKLCKQYDIANENLLD